MLTFVAIAASVVVAGWLAQYLYNKYGKAELGKILVSIEGLGTKLDEFVADKELQLMDHLEEIALHNAHVSAKRGDVERATRIKDRLTELLK